MIRGEKGPSLFSGERSILIEAPAFDAFAYWRAVRPLPGARAHVPQATQASGAAVEAGIRRIGAEPIRTLAWELPSLHGAVLTMSFAPLEGGACWLVAKLVARRSLMGRDSGMREAWSTIQANLEEGREAIELAHLDARLVASAAR